MILKIFNTFSGLGKDTPTEQNKNFVVYVFNIPFNLRQLGQETVRDKII